MKPRVEFGLNLDYDARNILEMFNSKGSKRVDWSKKLPSDVKEDISKVDKNKRLDFIKEKLDDKYKKNEKEMKMILDWYEQAWREVEDRFFQRLEKVTGSKVEFDVCKAYLTTQDRCPRFPKTKEFLLYWLFSPWGAAKTCAHEILHFQYFDIWDKKFKGRLDERKDWTKYWVLSEAVTFLLNEEFSDILLVKDKGYPQHRKIRKDLSKIWRKYKNFDRFMEKAISYMKRAEK